MPVAVEKMWPVTTKWGTFCSRNICDISAFWKSILPALSCYLPYVIGCWFAIWWPKKISISIFFFIHKWTNILKCIQTTIVSPFDLSHKCLYITSKFLFLQVPAVYPRLIIAIFLKGKQTLCPLILRWLYCLTIMGCNFVFNDMLHQTLISNNGPWLTFPFLHIWWHYDDDIRF